MSTNSDSVVELSVIVCTRNGAARITGALDSLLRQQTDVEWELIVVDNGSTDDTLAVVQLHPGFPERIRIVDASVKRGLGHARNMGVGAALGEFVAFCDDDDEVDPRWVEELTRSLREHSFVGSCMEYRRLNDHRALIGRPLIQSTVLDEGFGYRLVNGACGVRREVWRAAGGNDETLTISSEDHDFAIRVQRDLGVMPVLAERAIYHYRLRTGLVASFQQARKYGYGYVQLAMRYGGPKMSADDWVRARRAWWWIASRAPFHLVTPRRSVWARQLGMRVGRIEASIAHRRWCL